MRISRLFVELATELRPLVDQHHPRARRGCGCRRGQAAGTATDHQQVRAEHREIGSQNRRKRRGVITGCPCADAVRPAHLGHAGTLLVPAVNRDHAVLAHAHAAEQAAWVALWRLPPGREAGADECCGDALAPPSRHVAAIDVEKNLSHHSHLSKSRSTQ